MADILRKTGSALTFIETPQNTQVSFSKGNLIVEDDGDVYYDPTTGSSTENRIKLKGALDGNGGEIKSDLTLVAPAVIHQAAEPTSGDVLVNKGYLDNQLQGVVHIENEETITGKKTFKNQDGINLVNYKSTKYNTANCKLSTQLPAGYEDITASPSDIDSNLYINNKAVATEEYVTDNYVKQVAGKGLSTNDFDNTAKSQLETAYTYSQADHAPTDAEKNVIVGIQQNGTDLVVDSTTRKVNINTPIPGDTTPLMDGTANQGSKTGYAREDHKHPTDTTRATDNEVVHLAGSEEINGVKIFINGIKFPVGDDTITLDGGVSAETMKSYLAVNGNLLPTIEYTDDHYAKKSDVTGVYKAKGNLVSANLNASSLTANNLGWVFNITDEFTIDENFLEYDASNPKTYPAGTNVVIVQATPDTYKFDVLSGFIDTSTFATDSTVVHKAGEETITGYKQFTDGISVTKGTANLGFNTTDTESNAYLQSVSTDHTKINTANVSENGVVLSYEKTTKTEEESDYSINVTSDGILLANGKNKSDDAIDSRLLVGKEIIGISIPNSNISMLPGGMNLYGRNITVDGSNTEVSGDNITLESDNLQCNNDIYFTNYNYSSDHTENSGGLVFKGNKNGCGDSQYNLYKIAPAPYNQGIALYSKANYDTSDKFSSVNGIGVSGVSSLHMNGLWGGLYLGYADASISNASDKPFVRINLADVDTDSLDPYVVNIEAHDKNGVARDTTLRGICTPIENTDAANKKYVDDNKVDDSTLVHLTGDEAITGTKTFNQIKLHSTETESDITISSIADDFKGTALAVNGCVVPDKDYADYLYSQKSSWLVNTLYSDNWSNNIYTYSSSDIKATTIIELYPASNITNEQFEALQSANIIGGTQTTGSIELKAMGDVPTIDIPVIVVIRQDT